MLTEGNIDISPKLREGKLEIKFREQTEDFADETSKSFGLIERWNKWEWKYADVDKKKDEARVSNDDPVVAAFMKNTKKDWYSNVTKVRWQRKFEFDNAGNIRPATKKFIKEGFKGEVTELKVNDEVWWTIAFEIVEDPNDPMKDPIQKLRQGLAWIFEGKDYDWTTLKAESSYSYPAWLARKDARKAR